MRLPVELALLVSQEPHTVSLVFCDNQSVIAQLLRRNLSPHPRHIHINLGFIYEAVDNGDTRINLGFVYEAIDNGDIRTVYIRSEANPVNTHAAAELENRGRFTRKTTLSVRLGNAFPPISELAKRDVIVKRVETTL